ncbi:hypothetical protein SALBM135S_02511 [Streptomyces alboniger]
MKESSANGSRVRSFWRCSRASVCWSMISSLSGGQWPANTARAYPSVCNNPGTSRGSYENRLKASASMSAKFRKNLGNFARSTSS